MLKGAGKSVDGVKLVDLGSDFNIYVKAKFNATGNARKMKPFALQNVDGGDAGGDMIGGNQSDVKSILEQEKQKNVYLE